MDPITVETTIARPREEVFEYLADIANHAEFTDHFMVDWRLTREDTYGYGAGARYKIKAPLNRFPWADSTIIELEPGAGGTTRVRFTLLVEPKTLTDRLLQSFGARGWMKRKLRKSMRRLTSILEEGEGRGQRATIAGG